MKDMTKKAWKCGKAPNTECKCHGTLWLGAAKRPDNKAEVKTWEEFRYFKHLPKSKAGFALCNPKEFGSDPLPGLPKACWCEDKPKYEANLCADDGDDCLCNGYALYGQKFVAKSKKVNDFKGLIDNSFAILEVKEGQNSIACSEEAFGGVDPFPEGEKMCFCDQEKKFFDKENVEKISEYWEAQKELAEGKGELKGTKVVKEELVKEATTKTEEWTQELEVEEAEKKVTL